MQLVLLVSTVSQVRQYIENPREYTKNHFYFVEIHLNLNMCHLYLRQLTHFKANNKTKII